jgi:hypothetical protein
MQAVWVIDKADVEPFVTSDTEAQNERLGPQAGEIDFVSL